MAYFLINNILHNKRKTDKINILLFRNDKKLQLHKLEQFPSQIDPYIGSCVG